MNEHAYRFAAYATAGDSCAPAAVTAYAGAVAAAMHRAHAEGTTLACQLIAELSSDPVTHAAATEIGPFTMLTLSDWLTEVWGAVDELAAVTEVPELTADETLYRRATIELFAETDPDASTAMLAFAAALAVAHVRWLAAGIDGLTDPAATAVIGAVLAEDPVAAAAREELDEATRASIAMAVGNKWTEIMERVGVMVAVHAIEDAAA
ncbi:hypothetical protein [Mycobacteroides abscessus]|uniref:hypothetical protein n=1 Tax=Mycobacteroides abscessus TaxID=36809 RepID=UPI00078C85FA|nr:hypothetical protein [Mycobacteroides abscessus]AMU49391.1 hypothetical protein A3O01_03950 [Mycobacteroides abscessus]ANO08063.1 hypothetical protein BAB76_03950 [Mycobacteroides abscessus]MDM3921124.1 hypothetical protein [Mycobacteroides abscessus]MDO2965035.1 hypothetical protein [Mycobacteroides abscessus subsp. abscessus]MDO3260244.1 hypothetical protein [Mycobacteroides abscessus subsp. abscessus]